MSCDEMTALESRLKELQDAEELVGNAEYERSEAEAKRQDNENTRIQQEAERQENNRKTVELIRTASEMTEECGKLLDKMETATTKAEKSAESAQKASEAAELSTKKAEGAASDATKAADECRNVTKQANDALENQSQLDQTLETALRIESEVKAMHTDVQESREQIEGDKAEINETIKNSLIESSGEILDSVKSYYERAESLYSSLYIDVDGETPALRSKTVVTIDCGRPASRLKNGGGMDFDGGTPLSRTVAY